MNIKQKLTTGLAGLALIVGLTGCPAENRANPVQNAMPYSGITSVSSDTYRIYLSGAGNEVYIVAEGEQSLDILGSIYRPMWADSKLQSIKEPVPGETEVHLQYSHGRLTHDYVKSDANQVENNQ